MKEKINKILILGLLLLVPTQLGKHWWPDWSLVQGQRVDYLSPTLYLIDLVFLWILVLNWEEIKKMFSRKWVGVFLFGAINILIAGNKAAAGMGWLRLGEWLMALFLLWQKRDLWIKDWWWLVSGWVVVESSLGLAQVVKGGSLQGWWYWLGERRFTVNTIGIAQMGVEGKGMLRAYGTFSHPNSLAGFLLISLMWLWEGRSDFKGKKRIWWWMTIFFGFLGILISGSRTVWVLTMVVLGWKFLEGSQVKKRTIGFMAVLLGLAMMVFGLVAKNYQMSDYFSGWDQEGVVKRQELMTAAGRMIMSKPITGVGAGNFLSELPKFRSKNSGIFWLHPVHNIPLLWLSELGALGMIILGWVGWKGRKYVNRSNAVFLGVIAITAMIDHYWVSLPQNRWLLAVLVVWLVSGNRNLSGKARRIG